MKYDVIVIGGGHAGCEAALAAARLGASTLLLTINNDHVAQMSCNPAIGGIAKGQVVREIDALGGELAQNTDATSIQFRMLNDSKGAAALSPRAQCDKVLYQKRMKLVIERTPNLDEDTVMEYALDAGADDVISEDDAFEVHTSVANFSQARKYLEDKGLNFFEAEIRMVPQNMITLSGDDLVKFQKLVDALEELDDVQDVYHNVDLPEDEEE